MKCGESSTICPLLDLAGQVNEHFPKCNIIKVFGFKEEVTACDMFSISWVCTGEGMLFCQL